MARPRSNVSEAELDVMKVLWGNGPGTVRQITRILRSEGREWVSTTVQTLLFRLRDKGYVSREKGDTAHIYRAGVTRGQLLHHGLTEIAARLCDGSASPLVRALIQNNRFSAEEIDEFHRLLQELRRRRSRKGT